MLADSAQPVSSDTRSLHVLSTLAVLCFLVFFFFLNIFHPWLVELQMQNQAHLARVRKISKRSLPSRSPLHGNASRQNI